MKVGICEITILQTLLDAVNAKWGDSFDNTALIRTVMRGRLKLVAVRWLVRSCGLWCWGTRILGGFNWRWRRFVWSEASHGLPNFRNKQPCHFDDYISVRGSGHFGPSAKQNKLNEKTFARLNLYSKRHLAFKRQCPF